MTLLLFFFFLQNQSIALTWSAEDLMPPTERHIFSFNSKEELKKWHLYSDSEYGGIYILNCKSPLHSYIWSYAQYAKKELRKLMCHCLNIICEYHSIFFLAWIAQNIFFIINETNSTANLSWFNAFSKHKIMIRITFYIRMGIKIDFLKQIYLFCISFQFLLDINCNWYPIRAYFETNIDFNV